MHKNGKLLYTDEDIEKYLSEEPGELDEVAAEVGDEPKSPLVWLVKHFLGCVVFEDAFRRHAMIWKTDFWREEQGGAQKLWVTESDVAFLIAGFVAAETNSEGEGAAGGGTQATPVKKKASMVESRAAYNQYKSKLIVRMGGTNAEKKRLWKGQFNAAFKQAMEPKDETGGKRGADGKPNEQNKKSKVSCGLQMQDDNIPWDLLLGGPTLLGQEDEATVVRDSNNEAADLRIRANNVTAL